jgi:Ion channel
LLLLAFFLDTKAQQDAIPFAVIGLGALMLVVLTLIHGAGLDRIIALYDSQADRLRKKKRHARMAMLAFASAILLMLFLHLAEISLWGVVLHKIGLVPNSRDAVYFAANTYTTLGMGPMALPHDWRELSPMIAIAGLFTFAWTTSEMFNLVGSNRELVKDLRANHKRSRTHDTKEKGAGVSA